MSNTARAQVVALEKKCVDLENLLSSKDKTLDFAEEKLRSAEENVALVVEKKDKQSSDLMSFQQANEDLKVQLRDLDKGLKEAELKGQAAESRVAYLESGVYTAGSCGHILGFFCIRR